MTTTTQIFKSKQVTMVQKCRKTSKELPTSAQPSRAQKPECNSTNSQEKSHEQPPPASQHWSVLTLDHVVPLFDMRANTSKNIYDIMRSSREALSIQKLTTIRTSWLSQIEEDLKKYVFHLTMSIKQYKSVLFASHFVCT